MKQLIVLCWLLCCVPVMAVDPTSLKQNILLFSNGGQLEDNITDKLPKDTLVPADVDYTNYLEWLATLGMSAEEIGTFNIVGKKGTDASGNATNGKKNLYAGKFIPYELDPNYFKSLGIPDAKVLTGGSGLPAGGIASGNLNVVSSLSLFRTDLSPIVAKIDADTHESLKIYADNDGSYITGYNKFDATLIASDPAVMAFQEDSGDVQIGYQYEEKYDGSFRRVVHVDTYNGTKRGPHVGINAAGNTSYSLNVNGSIKANNIFGKMGLIKEVYYKNSTSSSDSPKKEFNDYNNTTVWNGLSNSGIIYGYLQVATGNFTPATNMRGLFLTSINVKTNGNYRSTLGFYTTVRPKYQSSAERYDSIVASQRFGAAANANIINAVVAPLYASTPVEVEVWVQKLKNNTQVTFTGPEKTHTLIRRATKNGIDPNGHPVISTSTSEYPVPYIPFITIYAYDHTKQWHQKDVTIKRTSTKGVYPSIVFKDQVDNPTYQSTAGQSKITHIDTFSVDRDWTPDDLSSDSTPTLTTSSFSFAASGDDDFGIQIESIEITITVIALPGVSL